YEWNLYIIALELDTGDLNQCSISIILSSYLQPKPVEVSRAKPVYSIGNDNEKIVRMKIERKWRNLL
ncbi:MAG TPA: hypothetical protein VN455_14390, partial [Methanotrichaceae archaeon]|nr:hypothetical protein [Methanotrichaceae archaeon]